MRRILDTSEVLGTVHTPDGACEVCASANAQFDEDQGRMVLQLDAFLRPTDLLAKERHFRAAWLPPNETVKETVEFDDSGELAREIFHRWVRRIRTAAPPLHQV